MRLLRTGHDGSIGSALVPLARAAGHEVAGLDCGLFGACRLGEPTLGPDLELDRDLWRIDASRSGEARAG